MLSESLGDGFACALLVLIAIPGLFLSLAPLLLETGYVARSGPPSQSGLRTAGGAGGGTGAGNLPPVLAKPWYPERHIGPDGEELPMSLGGTDVGPIRYRESAPEAPGSTAVAPPPLRPQPPVARAPIPVATPPPPPAPSAGTKKAPVISGVRYRDEAVEPPAPLTKAPRDQDPDDQLPSGVRFAPSTQTPAAVVPPAALPPSAPTEAPAPESAPAVRARVAVEPPTAGAALGRLASASDVPDVIDATFVAASEPIDAPPAIAASADDGIVAAWVAANPLPAPTEVELPTRSDGASAVDSADVAAGADSSNALPAEAGASASNLHPSVVGHRRKLAESGIFEGTSPAADRPGRPPKPKPRPAAAKDWREALHGLFSSLPVEELPPIRVPDELVGPSAEEEARLRADAPGQLKLFDASETTADGRAAGTRDALFDASVDAALERGTASLVLLKRKLGVGYARAASLMDALVAEGVLGEMTASGSRPTLLTQAEWNRRKRR